MKNKIRSSVFATLATLLFAFGNVKTDSLRQVTNPHLGTYTCQRAYYGSTDVLEGFSYIRLELKDKETYILSFCEKGGKKQEKSGRYTFNEEKRTLMLYADGGIQRSFSLEKGVLTVDVPILGKMLYLQFKQN